MIMACFHTFLKLLKVSCFNIPISLKYTCYSIIWISYHVNLAFSNFSFLFPWNLGFSEFKKVDILWKDVNRSKSCKGTPNGLYLRVYMSESCEKIKFWGTLVGSCLQIREMIDWDCSHPDDVNLMTLVYGIDAARMLFLNVSSTNAISCCFISYPNSASVHLKDINLSRQELHVCRLCCFIFMIFLVYLFISAMRKKNQINQLCSQCRDWILQSVILARLCCLNI